jgi:hypothetical protein
MSDPREQIALQMEQYGMEPAGCIDEVAGHILALLVSEDLIRRQTLIEDFTRIADNQIEDYGSPWYQAADWVRQQPAFGLNISKEQP